MGSVSHQSSKNKVIFAHNLQFFCFLFFLYLSSKENVETWILCKCQ